MLRIVRTGLSSRHSVALPAVKRDVELQRLGLECALPELIKDIVRIKGPVIITNAGVVASDNEMRATKVLANEGVKQRLARTRIAHLDRIARLHDRPAAEIILDHCANRPGADIGRNVAWLQFSEHLMDENAVRYLQRDFYQVFVTAVHGIASLEGDDPRPAQLVKHGPRLGRPDIEFGILGRIFALAQHSDAAGQIDVPLRQYLCHAWMLRIGGAIDLLSLQLLVD